MAYTATALIRSAGEWSGQECDLDDVADLDSLTDLVRDLAPDGATTVLFVEEDDDYVAVVRVDGDDEPRVFLSDQRAVAEYALVAKVFADAVVVVDDSESDEDDDESPRAEGRPAGDPELLADLGTPGPALLDLVAEEGMLPSDVIYALCERAGCVDVLEEVRGGL